MPSLTVADILGMRLECAKRGVIPIQALGIPSKLVPVFQADTRYKGAFGGRGSSKTRSFGLMTAVMGDLHATQGRSGVILCVREFQNSLKDSSFAEVAMAIRSDHYLSTRWEIGKEYIRHVTGKVEYIFRGLRSNTESLKGIARILLAWADEAEQILEESWSILIPTVREEGSEIYVTWNPATERSATHKRFRVKANDNMSIVEMNWRDNPYFPKVLEDERLADKEARPDDYDHIWEGGFRTVTKGAYIARDMTKARVDGRITTVPHDPLLIYRLFVDIGGTGARADNFVIWVKQFVGKTINVLDHYEVQGQPIAAHLKWMRENKYEPGNTKIWLPHDGDQNDRVFDVNYRSALEDAGYDVEVVPNQGKGAAMFRVEAARRMMPAVWFNENTTEAGRKALAHYHAKIDEARGIDLGPEHDWSSHSFDAFGMGCLVYEEPAIAKKAKSSGRQRHWMG